MKKRGIDWRFLVTFNFAFWCGWGTAHLVTWLLGP